MRDINEAEGAATLDNTPGQGDVKAPTRDEAGSGDRFDSVAAKKRKRKVMTHEEHRAWLKSRAVDEDAEKPAGQGEAQAPQPKKPAKPAPLSAAEVASLRELLRSRG